MSEQLVSDAMLDRFEAFARALDFHSRRQWQTYFETLIREAGHLDEASLVKGVFRYVERERIWDLMELPDSTRDAR